MEPISEYRVTVKCKAAFEFYSQLNLNRNGYFDVLISLFLFSCHEKATEALYVGRIQTRLGLEVALRRVNR